MVSNMKCFNIIQLVFFGVILLSQPVKSLDNNLRGETTLTSKITESISEAINEVISSTTASTRNLVYENDALMNYFGDPYFSGVETTHEDGRHFDKVVSGPFDGPELPLLNDPSRVVPIIQDEIEDRVIGGYNVQSNEKHYALLLYWNSTHWKWAGCGSTLVSACHVVTAAHCLENIFPVQGVFTNAIAPYNDNNGMPYHFSFIEQHWTHDDYDDISNQADIAVIKLADCVNSNEFPYAIPANPRTPITDGTNTEINGFGVMADDDESLPNVLQQATVPFISRNNCRNDYYGDEVLDDMVCAGYARGGVDACQGDSGSGLVRNEPNGDVTHFGIVSWGVGCGNAGSPGVYIAVSYYFDWLHSTICTDEDARANWCHPQSDGYNPNNGNHGNNGNFGTIGGIKQAPPDPNAPVSTPRPTPPPTPHPTPTPPIMNANNVESVNDFCNMAFMTCTWHTDCCSGVCAGSALGRVCQSFVNKQSFANKKVSESSGRGGSNQGHRRNVRKGDRLR